MEFCTVWHAQPCGVDLQSCSAGADISEEKAHAKHLSDSSRLTSLHTLKRTLVLICQQGSESFCREHPPFYYFECLLPSGRVRYMSAGNQHSQTGRTSMQ